MVETIIDTGIYAGIHFHGILNRFRERIGVGEATMELKLTQDLASVDHNPLFLVLLDLRKVYYTMDRVRLIQTLEGYGAVSCLCELMVILWVH